MRTPDRRDALRVALAGGAAMLLPKAVVAQEAAFSLPKLPYSFDALEPHIDAKTMEIHWGRHHKAYVDNLNKALAGKAEWEKKTIEEILKSIADVPAPVGTTITHCSGLQWVPKRAASPLAHWPRPSTRLSKVSPNSKPSSLQLA